MHTQSNILVIGSANTDMIVQVPRLPAAGETLLGGTFQQAAGGKGANQAVAAARLGGQVTFLACIGDDALGQQSLAGYQADGIDTSAMIISQNAPSGVALIMVNAEGENCIAVASGANAQLTPAHINQHITHFDHADIILLQLETPLETVSHAIDVAFQRNKSIILNPAPAQALPDSLLKKLTLITPNESEASLLTGISVKDEATAHQAAQALHHKGVKEVLITLGELGVYYCNAQSHQLIPPFKVKAVDTTAAGDTFNGALACALGQQMPMPDAIRFAQASAALSVTKAGAQPSIPTNNDVTQFLNSGA